MKHVNHRRRELLLEMTVGIFMFAVLVGLAFFTIILSHENYLAKTYPIEVLFEDVMGLRDGDNVVIRGMTVGKVKSLKLQADGVLVLATLQRPLNLKEDYSVKIISTSVLGGRYLQIEEGRAEAELPADEIIRGESPKDLMLLAADVAADIKDLTAKIKAGEGTLGKLLAEDDLYTDLQDIVANVKLSTAEDGLLGKLERTADNLETITAKINQGEGTIGKLLQEDTLYEDAREILASVKQSTGEDGLLGKLERTASDLEAIAAKINQGEGTLGKLVSDSSMHDEIMATLGDARKTLDDVRETSPLVTFTSILFGAL